MKKTIKIIRSVFLSAVIILPPAVMAENSPQSIKRYSLIIGANNGGPSRDILKYAVKDAESFESILHRIGGVDRTNSTILRNPRKNEIISKFNSVLSKINRDRKLGRRTEFIFYYSGHSDEESLFLGKEKMYYSDISRRIKQMPSDVKIAILDSCSSGAFTRTKGGKKKAPFLVDSSFNMKGYAFLTSSSADEVSQESDRIQGSFFTHYLNTGLLGAAEMSGDKRITLNEAYQYAYSATLSRTEKTRGGPQHPNYNIQMNGTGDVVMTDINNSPALLSFGEDISGRLFIHDSNERLIAEIIKPAGRKIQIGLEEGKYTIINLNKGRAGSRKITITENKNTFIASADFTNLDREVAVARGDKRKTYRRITVHPALMPDSSGKETIVNVSVSILGDYCSVLEGVSLTPGVMIVDEELEGAQFAGVGNITGKDSRWFQGAGCFNVSLSSFTGVQLAGTFNYSGNDFKGCQAAPAFNYNTNNFKGAQLSGVFNHTGENMSGTQLSPCFNNSGGTVTGFQGSAVFNRTGLSMTGAQLSCVNIAGDTKGAQIGLVNIADRAKGLQLGLVNISDDIDGIPIGLVNIIKNGETYGELWYDNAGFVKTSLTHGKGKFYYLYSLGIEETGDLYSIGIGFGTHFQVTEDLFINFDICGNSIERTEKNTSETNGSLHSQARLYTGYRINSSISLIGGISYNYLTSFGNDNVPMFDPDLYKSSGSDKHRHWLGFFLGMRI